MRKNYTKICDNVRLSYKLNADAIYITDDGNIVITAKEIPDGTKIPAIDLEWLDAMCMKHTFKTLGQAFTISDILVRDGIITFAQAVSFYKKIESNLCNIMMVTT